MSNQTNSKLIKISSLANAQVKYFSSLNNKKVRTKEKKYLVEGFHLCEEAAKRNVLSEVLICDESDKITGVNNYLVTYDIIKKITKSISPQKMVGVVDIKKEFSYDYDQYLLLDDVSDPGNLGTIIRSAVAFGIKALIMSPNSVDIYNDKVIRATQGALFDIDYCYEDLTIAIPKIKRQNILVYGTALNNSISINSITRPDKWALIMGNESRGISSDILEQSDYKIKIPISENIDSLNVAISAGIILYEFSKSTKEERLK